MNTQKAYNTWAAQYDTNENKTRDLEEMALRTTLADSRFVNCLEIGCGTGKNTEWLLTKTTQITAVDFSEDMLSKAKEKLKSKTVEFIQTDINTKWSFRKKQYDLVTFSLVLEHIENLEHIFTEVSSAVVLGGLVYIGELHPYKQYSGSKARFETKDGIHVLECFNHNISDFIQIAKKNGFTLVDLNEYFDDNNRNEIPRVLTMVLKKI